MKLLLNDKALNVEAGITVEAVLNEQQCNTEFCAIAINNRIIPKSQWAVTTLQENDVLSVFNAIAGG